MAAPGRGGLSLYADLLGNADSSASGQQEQTKSEAQQAKPIASALQFQPIRRPQTKQPAKSKPTFPKAFTAVGTATTVNNGDATAATSTGAQPAVPQPQRSTLADWAPTEEDEYLYGSGIGGGGRYHGRGGRNKRKKKKNAADNLPVETNWDDLYDPARPTNVEEYLQSDERYREIMDWKDVLYAHRRRRSRSRSRSGSRRSSYSNYSRRSRRSYSDWGEEEEDRRPVGDFAPPAALSFAPPPVSPPRASIPAAAPVPNDPTGDHAYARRLALSGVAPAPPPPPPPPPISEAYQASPPINPPTEPPRPAEPGVISQAAPVLYEQPRATEDTTSAMDIDEDEEDEDDYIPPPIGSTAPDNEEPQEEEDQPRSRRPGQADFAQRLMSKYGWTQGSGLGASESGITSALRVKVEKRKKRPDSEGGGFAEPKGGRGKIIGGTPAKKSGSEADNGGSRFGKMSEVIVLDQMLAGMAEEELEADMESGDLKQEIGTECGDKYGTIEKISVDVAGRRVFIKFTNQVSALRAVNDLEGRIYNGNAIAVKFFDLDEFEKGVYR